MSLSNRKSPSDPSPDWVDQTYGQRVSSAIMTLLLFGFLTEQEAVIVTDRIEKWYKKWESEGKV